MIFPQFRHILYRVSRRQWSSCHSNFIVSTKCCSYWSYSGHRITDCVLSSRSYLCTNNSLRNRQRCIVNTKNDLHCYRTYCSSVNNSCRTMKIDTPHFRALFSPELKALADIFSRNGYELRLAGGAVRDLLMSMQPHDLDFATTATPTQMQEMFSKEGIRMINNKGEKHGTITCRINEKENFEVTTLRIDVVTDGRHAEVEFTHDWKLDAERRDLTINSLFLGLDGTLYDYFGGREDLDAKRVRFVGNAASRIQEDYLRILRYFRFFGRISDLPNSHADDTLSAIRENAAGLANISGERVWVEMKKILLGRYVDSIVRVMSELNVLVHIGFQPRLNIDELAAICKTSADLECRPATFLSALLYTEHELLRLHERVKMSKDELQLVQFIITHRQEDWQSVVALDWAQDVVTDNHAAVHKTKERVLELLKYRNDRQTLDEMTNWQPPKFPVNGIRLMELGVPKGPQFAKVLGELREQWKRSRYQMTEDELLATVNATQRTAEEAKT